MRLGKVIGRVTMCVVTPMLTGGRWLIVSPLSREQYADPLDESTALSREPSLIVYDALGADVGQTIGFVEGREAASPFDKAPPIDAISAALVDKIFYNPL